MMILYHSFGKNTQNPLSNEPIYAIKLLIPASRAGGLAPTTSETFVPLLKSMKVGIARTPSSAATLESWSTSIL